MDVKAEHFERQVQRVEQERDVWEKKYEVRLGHRRDLGRSCVLSSVPFYRMPKPNTASPKQNWTSSFRTWKACDEAFFLAFSAAAFIPALSRSFTSMISH